METNNLLKVCGSIIKKESIIRVKPNTLPHTWVAEANLPYSNYYGRVPEKPEPNSLFLFTERYYTLEESLRFTQNIDICAKNKVNTASAFLEFKTQRYPAIRIKNFPDYQHLQMLQECFIKQGVKFTKKVNLEPEAIITVNKCFVLEIAEEGLFLDKSDKNEGYIAIPKRFSLENFNSLMQAVWNNTDCMFFDAAMGGLIIDGNVTDMVRIYSGHLDVDLLKCVKKVLLKQIESVNTYE